MPVQQYFLRYGKREISFPLESDWGAEELKIKEHPTLPDPAAAIRKAIREPIQSPPLREIIKRGEKVAFIVNDTTRVANSHVFMPILLDELNDVGVPDRDIFIMFALGTHHELSREEMTRLVGSPVAQRVPMYNSIARHTNEFKKVGTTSRGNEVCLHHRVVEADKIVLTGSIVYHFMAGFGGGRKALFPGVAAYETIRKNHALMLEPGAGMGKMQGNPVTEDQIEGTEMLRPAFLLNGVLNEKHEFLEIFAGDYIQAHRVGCRSVEKIYGTEISQPADLVIASCGGYPKDINVYQLQKTMDNTWLAVRDGGVVILLGECVEGVGSDLYLQWMKEHQTPERIEEKIRCGFVIGGHKAYAVTRLMKKAQFILLSGLDPNLARMLLFTPARDMAEALRIAAERVGSRPRIILMPQGSLTVPLTKS